MGNNEVIVYGEAYGGKEQGMSNTYGKQLKFIVFDIQIDDHWLSVPNAENVAQKLGLEFVAYEKIKTDIDSINAQRDANSVQAVRNGITEPRKREGIVLRPLIEMYNNNNERIICKHKHDDFKETNSSRKIVDPARLEVLTKAKEIADEWVTDMRLEHVIQKFPGANIEDTSKIIEAMYEDVMRESVGEIVESKELKKEIFTKTAKMFQQKLKNRLYEQDQN